MSNKRIFIEMSIEELASIINVEFTKALQKSRLSQFDEQILNKREVAEYFQVTQRTVDNWIDAKWLISYRIGNQIRFKKSEVQEALRKIIG